MSPRAAARLESLGFEDVHEYRAGKLDWLAAGLPTEGENSKSARAGDIARHDVPVCGLKARLGDVRDRARAAGWEAAVVVDQARIVLGLLRAKELAMDSDATVEQVMRPGPSTFRPYVPIKEMADYMVEHSLESSPVTTSDGRLVGLLMMSDAVERAASATPWSRRMIWDPIAET
jgi:predicted transcriptional regulator